MRESRKSQLKRMPTSQSTGEGAIWELFLFAVLFVLIFSAIARANLSGSSQGPNSGRVPSSISASLGPR